MRDYNNLENMSKFGYRLKELMAEEHLNAENLGNKIGCRGAVVRKWFSTCKDISLSSLIKLSDYFGCSLDYLCGRSDDFLNYEIKSLPNLMNWMPIVIKECGKTSYRIFKETPISSSHFTSWRKGSEPKLSSLVILADYLGCTLDRLIGRDR